MMNNPNLVRIYVATHSEKCELTDNNRVLIQVGAANSKKKIAPIQDDCFDNISEKNDMYCELTALYWIWKNTNEKIIGLEHYRRRFNSRYLDLYEISKKHKVIVSKPYYYKMSIEEQYKKTHIASDWNCMIEGIKELYPDYLSSVENIFRQSNKIYPYNMFIGERQFVDEYCEWLFPLLKYIENNAMHVQRDKYQKRFIGFLAERLFTLYIEHNYKNIIFCRVNSPDQNNIIKRLKYMITVLKNRIEYSLNEKFFGGSGSEKE